MFCRECGRLTPWLDVKGNDRLGGNLGLGGLLLLVGSETLLTDANGLRVLLLVGAEQVDVIVVLSSGLGGRSLGRVHGDLGDLRAVDGVGLGSITGESGELILERGNVLVPPGSGRVLGGIRGAGESLEGGDIGLRRSVAGVYESANRTKGSDDKAAADPYCKSRCSTKGQV